MKLIEFDINKGKLKKLRQFLDDVLYLKNDISFQIKYSIDNNKEFNKSKYMNNNILGNFETVKLINDIVDFYESNPEGVLEFSSGSLRINNNLVKSRTKYYNYFLEINNIKIGVHENIEGQLILRPYKDGVALLEI